jgi:hypothetical protein
MQGDPSTPLHFANARYASLRMTPLRFAGDDNCRNEEAPHRRGFFPSHIIRYIILRYPNVLRATSGESSLDFVCRGTNSLDRFAKLLLGYAETLAPVPQLVRLININALVIW